VQNQIKDTVTRSKTITMAQPPDFFEALNQKEQEDLL
jgi:hypothetical protein